MFENWSDAQLIEYEHELYDREVDGEDTWMEREEVLKELDRRDL
jgi:hypothetical protein